MTLNGVMAVILRYFTAFGKHAFQQNNRVDLWRNLCTRLLYFVVRVRYRLNTRTAEMGKFTLFDF